MKIKFSVLIANFWPNPIISQTKCQNKWIKVTNRAIFEISDQETVSPENEKEISEEHRGVKNAEETNKKCNSNNQVPSSPSKQRTINQYNDHFKAETCSLQ